jgi:hypothetical protein
MKPWFVSPLQFLLGWFGYAKIPVEVVQLAIRIRFRAAAIGDLEIYDATMVLEKFLRSCRKLGI